MDISALVHAVTTFLLPALPYLVKAGEAAAEETGKNVLGAAWDGSKSLWQRLWANNASTPPQIQAAQTAALQAAQVVVQDPRDADLQAVFRVQLKSLLTQDQSLAAEIEQLLAKAQAAAGNCVVADRGGVAIGDNATGNTIITGGVKGDFIAGNKDKS